jgi:2-polyprenyl-3-methyl-5-hydroxy-6-metoxy-1,4-benzoquinol methylase
MAFPSSTVSSDSRYAPRASKDRSLSLVETRCCLCGSRQGEPEANGYDFEYETVSNEFRFVRCAGCGHLYLSPRPSSADLGIIYPTSYYAFSDGGSPLVARLRRVWEGGKVRLYRELIGGGPRRLLEVGCANGRFLSLLREYGDPGWKLVGIDPDEAAVRQCVERGFDAHASRVEDFTGRDEEFDAVIMLQLIEHVEDPAEICSRVYSLLRPGGHFVVETPNLAGLDYRLFKGRWWGHYHFPRHWNLFSTPALHRLLEEKGFAIARSEYLISTSAWIISLHNYFLDRGFPDWLVRFCNYQNPLLLSAFVALDWSRARLGLETSNQRVIARKPD